MSFKKLVILRVFAMDYHSGQWSRGYKLLCMTTRALERTGTTFSNPHSDNLMNAGRRTKLYKDLVEKYGDKI